MLARAICSTSSFALVVISGLALVAVVGVSQPVHGEEIKAFVVPRPGEAADPEQIIAWCRERMAAYKYPRMVEVVQALPMTATGKILKRALRP